MRKEDKQALERYKKRLEFAKSAGTVNAFETKVEQTARIDRAKKDYAFMCQQYFPHYATCEPAECHLKAARQVIKNPTIKKFGIYDNFDGYFWETRNNGQGDNFSVVRRSQSLLNFPNTLFAIGGTTAYRGKLDSNGTAQTAIVATIKC